MILIQLDIIFIKIFFTLILVNYDQESILLLFFFDSIKSKKFKLKQKSTSVNMYTFMYLILDFCGV